MAHRDDTNDSLSDKSQRAADAAFRRHDEPPTTADVVAEGTGGVAGAAAGAALGSLAGPIGTIIGGLAGAVGGWWSGRAIAEAAGAWNDDDDAYYRTRYESTYGRDATSSRLSYNDRRPAYQLGHLAGVNPDYRDRSFDEIEPQLRNAYTSSGRKDWSDVRHDVRDAYARGREVGEQRLTLSEEELHVGKRQVQAGEVGLRKTVETEHVREQVPLVREEVTIERRPVSGSASTNVEIGEDEIRIPVMAEEAVVDKRVVGKEEVVVRKEARTENQTVEADLRRERLDVDKNVDTTRGRGAAGGSEAGLSGAADRATDSGPLDRLADRADDLKDRVDANPASKPGPDRTDRRI